MALIPTAHEMVTVLGTTPQPKLGDMATQVLAEYYKAHRVFLEEHVQEEPYLKSYLKLYDQATKGEIVWLSKMNDEQKAEWARLWIESFFIWEMIALDELLESPDPAASDKKKKASEHAQKELEELKGWMGDWFGVPKWIEIILKTIIDIFA